MLVQITNTCEMNCPHCLQSSTPEPQHMKTVHFWRSIQLTKELGGVMVISGGEPTLHPEFYNWMKELNFRYKMPFTICTNGSWYKNEDMCSKIKRVASFDNCVGIQVYTNPKWYRMADEIIANKDVFKSLGHKVIFETMDIRSMEDLGRAKTSPEAQKEVETNPYGMSCLNPALIAAQSHSRTEFKVNLRNAFLTGKLNCKPFIDWQGNIHMSESIHCPTVCNIMQSTQDILDFMWAFKPCGGCKNFTKFKNSSDPKYYLAQKILL